MVLYISPEVSNRAMTKTKMATQAFQKPQVRAAIKINAPHPIMNTMAAIVFIELLFQIERQHRH